MQTPDTTQRQLLGLEANIFIYGPFSAYQKGETGQTAQDVAARLRTEGFNGVEIITSAYTTTGKLISDTHTVVYTHGPVDF